MIPDIVFGYIGIGLLFVFLFLGVPIFLSMGLAGFIGLICIANLGVAQTSLASLAFQWGTNWILISLPLFILMGLFAFHSGISRDLYDTANKFIGHLPGGLAMSTVVACTAFGAASGSSLANAGAMGAIAVPEMERYGYDKGLAAGTVAAGGTIGVMMPPSMGLIVLGIITQQSIGKLFIAGILPALLIMVVYMMVIAIRVKLNPKLAPPTPAFSWKERIISFRSVGPIAAVFVLVIGGIYIGFFTPTEAGAVGAFGTFVLLLLRRRLTRGTLNSALTETGKMSAMIFLLFIGANVFANFLALTGLPMDLANWLVGLSVNPYLILALVLLIYIPIGCFMDTLSAWMVTLPIFYPLIESLGFNLIWFLILLQVVGELGLITPPVGLNVFVLKSVTNLSLSKIFAGVLPFVFADVVVLLILGIFPQISLGLLNFMT